MIVQCRWQDETVREKTEPSNAYGCVSYSSSSSFPSSSSYFSFFLFLLLLPRIPLFLESFIPFFFSAIFLKLHGQTLSVCRRTINVGDEMHASVGDAEIIDFKCSVWRNSFRSLR